MKNVRSGMLGEDCQNEIKEVLLFDEDLRKNLPRVHRLEPWSAEFRVGILGVSQRLVRRS
jgi:hypothetical protein